MKVGKFELLDNIGGGNFGEVFRAQDTLLDVERAVKIITVSDPKQFVDAINEAQILERCRHNYIVDIREIDIHDVRGTNRPCIVTEYLHNGSAQRYLEKTFVTVHKAVQIITDILFGLEHAHEQGIYHRDIKPANILFASNWQAKLSDFGLAYGLAHQTFSFKGYNSHLPPEVLEGTAQDNLSDLYSTGITLHRLVKNMGTLTLPFKDHVQWLKALKKETFPQRIYHPHIPEELIKVIKKCIKADRSHRYQTCLQLRQALQKIPLAVEWIYVNDELWKGEMYDDKYEITFNAKKSGYCIEFKKNGRKVSSKCFAGISSKSKAIEEFYKIIRQTTIKI